MKKQKFTRSQVNTVARLLWTEYVAAQPWTERVTFAHWDALSHKETLRGFRALARCWLDGGNVASLRCRRLFKPLRPGGRTPSAEWRAAMARRAAT